MEKYSVLMSVYHKDRPEWLKLAIESMLEQTCPPSQFVIVEDGPLSEKLEQVIESYRESELLKVSIVKLPVNGGLGPALIEGLKYCENDLIARMDSDDISLPDRCRLQVMFMSEHPEYGAVSGTLAEFEGEIPDDIDGCVKKRVPLENNEIRRYAILRNPINHPCVMERKSAVEKAGGYRNVPYFEDYDLWLRMLFDCNIPLKNLDETLLLMRTDGMYERRGGINYARQVQSFRGSMYKKGYIGFLTHVLTTVSRLIVSILPGGIRKRIYKSMLR